MSALDLCSKELCNEAPYKVHITKFLGTQIQGRQLEEKKKNKETHEKIIFKSKTSSNKRLNSP
ncbi:hypothetical protein L9F63_018028, partial [Diploptera punctata]